MELKRAKEVLTAIWGEKGLEIHSTYLATNGRIYLRASFNNEEIQAIATWMRDPEGVVKA